MILVSPKNKTNGVLTEKSLKALKGISLRLRFNGLSRAQMGGVLATLKTSDTVAHTKPFVLKKSVARGTNRKIYFDTQIMKKS
jgi:hypothetical protein